MKISYKIWIILFENRAFSERIKVHYSILLLSWDDALKITYKIQTGWLSTLPSFWLLLDEEILIRFFITACPRIGSPFKGSKICKKAGGEALCTLECDEGNSFDLKATTRLTCGPDTRWKWNGKSKLKLPLCTSKLQIALVCCFLYFSLLLLSFVRLVC